MNHDNHGVSRRTLLLGAGAAAAALAIPGLGVFGPATTAQAAAYSLNNALINQRADPHIVKHSNGMYYFTASVPEYNRLVVRGASTIAGLATTTERTVWTRTAGDMGGHIWAPELHYFNNTWYMYFAAGTSSDVFRVRPYVLVANGQDPLTATWSVLGRVYTWIDTFALDATTFSHNGTRYMVWAQNDPAVGSGTNLYISAMSGPTTLTGSQVRIATPTYAWETIGFRVNEGPAVIVRNGKVFISFSASATDSNYCMGLLTASATANLLSASSWTKSANPVFTSNSATSQYGPGHNSFTVSEDGTSDLLVYHSRNYQAISGDPLYDPNRNTRVQKLYWNADGTPNFGIPVAAGALPYRLRSYNFPDRYVRHWEYQARLDANVTNLADSQFRQVPGLAGGSSVSLESTNFPGRYLVDRGTSVRIEVPDGTGSFAGLASFTRRAGLASSSAVSFESVANPGRYLRHYAYVLYVQAVSGSTANADATFTLE